LSAIDGRGHCGRNGPPRLLHAGLCRCRHLQEK
jgi:hypothetical protein